MCRTAGLFVDITFFYCVTETLVSNSGMKKRIWALLSGRFCYGRNVLCIIINMSAQGQKSKSAFGSIISAREQVEG